MNRIEGPFVTLIVPVFNEEASIEVFLQTVEPILAKLGGKSEIVFVDDGSRDDTLAALRMAKARNAAIVILSLSRNFGKEAAMTAGLDHAKGDNLLS